MSFVDLGMINDRSVPLQPCFSKFKTLFCTMLDFFRSIPTIVAPLAQPEGLPARPFLLLSSFTAYFFALELAFRAPPRDAVTQSELELIYRRNFTTWVPSRRLPWPLLQRQLTNELMFITKRRDVSLLMTIGARN